MASERVDTVRRACEAWGAGDLSALRNLYAVDVSADGGELWPEGSGSVHGVDAVLGAFEAIMSAFERSELIPEGFLEAAEPPLIGRVLGRLLAHARLIFPARDQEGARESEAASGLVY